MRRRDGGTNRSRRRRYGVNTPVVAGADGFRPGSVRRLRAGSTQSLHPGGLGAGVPCDGSSFLALDNVLILLDLM